MKVICLKNIGGPGWLGHFKEGEIYDTRLTIHDTFRVELKVVSGYTSVLFNYKYFQYLDKHLDKKMNKLLYEVNN